MDGDVVRSMRVGLGLTQADFAVRFGIAIMTVRAWEQGRCHPTRMAATLLRVIERAPEVVVEALAA